MNSLAVTPVLIQPPSFGTVAQIYDDGASNTASREHVVYLTAFILIGPVYALFLIHMEKTQKIRSVSTSAREGC